MYHAFGSPCRLAAVLVVAAAVAVIGPDARAQLPTPNSGQMPYYTWLTSGLPPGFSAVEGTASVSINCSDFITAFGSCFGNNAVTPYIIPQPPLEPTSYLPAYATTGSFTQPIKNQMGQTTGTASDVWQLGNNEAIVTVITLPPQGAYFGFQTYMLERGATSYPGSAPSGTSCMGGTKNHVIYTEASDCNYVIFGNFNNTVNDADVQNFAETNPMTKPWNLYQDHGISIRIM